MKQLRQCFFVQIGPDDAEAAGVIGAAVAEVDLAGNIIELEPFAGCVLQDALGAEDSSVLFLIGELRENITDFVLLIALGRFEADVAEDFVGVMLTFAMVVMVMMMLMAVIVVMMMMFMFVVIMVVIVVMMFVIMIVIAVIIVMMMLMLVVVVIVVMLVMVVMLMFVVIVIVIMVVMSALFAIAVLTMLVMMVCML